MSPIQIRFLYFDLFFLSRWIQLLVCVCDPNLYNRPTQWKKKTPSAETESHGFVYISVWLFAVVVDIGAVDVHSA